MFNQIKDLYNLKKQAEELQKQMSQEKITASSSDNLVTITINGNQELLDVKIAPENLNSDKLEHAFKDAFSRAQSRLKNTMAEKFKGMI
jgi:DNA-binding YbaB/EbfC family protein